MSDDFCSEHGYEYMRSDFGNPIPYCELCEKERAMSKHEADAWDGRRLELRRQYIAEGMSPDEADDKATDDVRREIRNGPPITLPR